MKKNEKTLMILGGFILPNNIVSYSCGSSCTRQKNA